MAATMPRPLIRRVPLFSYFGVVYGVSLVALAVIGLRSLHRTTTQPAALVTFPVMVITVGLAGVGRTRAVPLDRGNRPGGQPTSEGGRGGASHRGSLCSDFSQAASPTAQPIAIGDRPGRTLTHRRDDQGSNRSCTLLTIRAC